MTQLDLGDGVRDARVGQWRLARIGLANWGTFTGIVAIDVARRGHLFTGASGSGKSSLLDAIAAVLTPDKWLRFNAAAQDGGSGRGDRTLMSYVRGAWTKEVDAAADRAVTTYLRAKTTWSGIVLRYENARDEPIVLARVFHAPGTRTDGGSLKDARIHARGDVGLEQLQPHVRGGIDARRMQAALGDGALVSAGRPGAYFSRVVKLFGFRSETTLQLLHRTQSAKSLGTLDALFRGFMLDEPATFARAATAVEQFTELDRAHAHVVDLREQADALRGIDASITAHDTAAAQVAEVAALHDAVEPYTSAVKLELAEKALGPARAAVTRSQAEVDEAARERDAATTALDDARQRMRDEGGARVEVMQERIASAEREERAIERARDELAQDLEQIGAPLPDDPAEFAELLARAHEESERAIEQVSYDVRDAAGAARRALGRIQQQVNALRVHRSAMDPRLLAVRARLADDLGLPAEALPFAGELVSVAPEHAPWRGAIERVLGAFATTMLVRDEYLARARRLIDGRNLGVRLAMEAVAPDSVEPRRPREARSLVHRVDVRDGAFSLHLRSRLVGEFDYACVDHPDELDDVERGLTIEGLVKRSSRRYEKDDRTTVGDASRWILGGDTAARLDALLEQLREAERVVEATGAAERVEDTRRVDAVTRQSVFRRVAQRTWAQIDAAAAAGATRALRDDLVALTSTSSTLRDAQDAHDRAAARRKDAEDAHERAARSDGIARDALAQVERDIAELRSQPRDAVLPHMEAALEARFRADRRAVTREHVDEVARRVQSALTTEKETAARRVADASAGFLGQAARYLARWQTAAPDLTVDLDDRYGYRERLAGIVARGLPEREEDFRRLLRDRSQIVVAHLQDDLRNGPGAIRDRVLAVNASLARSPFDGDDRFLQIDVKTARSPEVQEFLADLKRIVEGSWSDESVAGAEARFAVLQRVVGQLGSKERVDVAWQTRVLDTRLHVTFLAKEQDADGRTLRVYDSSEGLSGGQRQKLVIFCLAAALRYQLADDDDVVPTYGTIVLDEAFDKADSRYTRNAMDVFEDFGFHMILATPQKLLQTLEPYIGAVTSVSNPTRAASRVAQVPIEVWPDAAEAAADGVPEGER